MDNRTFLKGIKLSLIAIFVNYYCIPLLLGHLISYVTIIGYGMIFICYLLDNGAQTRITREILIWIFYLVICFVLCLFQENKSWIISSLFDFAKRIFLCYIVIYICIRDDSASFIVRFISILAVVLVILIIRKTNDISVRIGHAGTDTALLSTNDIGALFAFSCASIQLLSFKKKQSSSVNLIFGFLAIFLFLIGIMLSGSRKAIYAVLIFYALIFLICGRRIWNNLSINKLILLFVLLSVTVLIFIHILLPLFEKSSLYLRIFGRKVEKATVSSNERLKLIKTALLEFSNHPIIGLGFNNFFMVYHVYTHCTYVETLASSGIFGFLYLVPYFSVLKNQLVLCSYEKAGEYKQRVVLSFYIMFLFIGSGIPFVYKDIPTLLFGFFVGNQSIAFSKIEGRVNEKDSRASSYTRF